MPTEHTVTSYKYSELSDKAKEVARDWFREGALDYQWWDFVYDDAAQIGLKVTGFDLGRRQSLDAKLVVSPSACALAILGNHGAGCDTYKLAQDFLAECREVKGLRRIALGDTFVRDLKAAYWSILNSEMEYRLSDECVAEDIEANEYDFDAHGHRFHF
jgi:hypothetical protein